MSEKSNEKQTAEKQTAEKQTAEKQTAEKQTVKYIVKFDNHKTIYLNEKGKKVKAGKGEKKVFKDPRTQQIFMFPGRKKVILKKDEAVSKEIFEMFTKEARKTYFSVVSK